jgi:hypothetical protein
MRYAALVPADISSARRQKQQAVTAPHRRHVNVYCVTSVPRTLEHLDPHELVVTGQRSADDVYREVTTAA